MSVTISRVEDRSTVGYGQVEINLMDFRSSDRIFAQLPVAGDLDNIENGAFMKYDAAKGEVNLTGAGEWLMVYNEIHLYDDRFREEEKDYRMQKKDYFKGQMYPRLVGTALGDRYTTNCVADGVYEVEDFLTIGTDGILAANAATSLSDIDEPIVFQVIKETTMPDGLPAVKLMRVK